MFSSSTTVPFDVLKQSSKTLVSSISSVLVAIKFPIRCHCERRI